MRLTWLHISDFHIRDGDSYDRHVVLRALVKSVKNFREKGRVPDLVFATGDIAHSGKAPQYELATRFFDELLEAAGLDRHRLFVIPGNHDVDRDLGIGLIRTLESREQADTYFKPGVPILHLTQKLHAFLRWHNRYFESIRALPEDTTCAPAEIANIRGFRIGILPINSTLFCQDDSDHARLWVGRRCLDAAIQSLQALHADVNIALMHHPVDWLASIERPNIKASLQSNFDFILRGHLHENDVESVASTSGGALYCSAGAAYQTRRWPNRAVYGSIDSASLTIFPIRYEDQPSEIWTVDPSLFPHEPEYQKSFPIPRLQSRPSGTTDRRVLDAAIPTCIRLGQAAALLAQIRRSESGGLRAILSAETEWDATPEDVRSKPVTVEFPIGSSGKREPLRANLRVECPDFDPPQPSKNMIVPVEGDSEVCTFLLTPKRVGRLSINLEFIWEDSFRGARTLRTECAAECGAAGGRMGIATMSLFSISWTGAAALMRGGDTADAVPKAAARVPEVPSAPPDRSADPKSSTGAALTSGKSPEPEFPSAVMYDARHEGGVRAFLCHCHADKAAVRELWRRLRDEGIDPWLDAEALLPGQDWNLEIHRAVRTSDVVIVCLSRKATTKAGYVQKEIKFALDLADEQPQGTSFLIPVRLEECDVPERLQALHRVDLFDQDGYPKLLRALQGHARRVGPTPRVAPYVPNVPPPSPARSADHPFDASHQVKSRIPMRQRLRLKWVAIAAIAVPLVAIVIARWPSHNMPILGPPTPQRGYVWVPPGQYRMGCSTGDSQCFHDEIPQHPVKLSSGFFLMRTEVTNDNFRAYARATGAPIPYLDVGGEVPVATVTWDDAKAYCEWTGGRLPTEAEWEYAARAGSVEPFYGQPDAIAWYQGNTNSPRNVGQKQRNSLGLHDMLGNVSEWVNDRYDEKYYQSSPPADPLGPGSGERRVVRGGSYLDDSGSLRVSRREARAPDAKGAQVGFRCAKDAPQSGR